MLKGNNSFHRLIIMHNSLMRRYEKELKRNVQHVETITSLNVSLTQFKI